MRIQHNIMAKNSYRNYNKRARSLSKNLEKLSSGYKINRSADDAAGLAVSEKMRAQIAGLEQVDNNCTDGINLFDTADGALSGITDMLQRMHKLCLAAANDTYDEKDKESLIAEVEQLKSSIHDVSENSNYNGQPVLKFPPKPMVDIVFVVDTTGSMGDEINNVANCLNGYVEKLTERGISTRMALVDYRDYTDAHIAKKTAFTDDVDAFKGWLQDAAKNVNGGNDAPEAALEAIMDPDNGALSMEFDPAAKKHFVLVTDAEIHVKGDAGDAGAAGYKYTVDETVARLKDEDVFLTVVGGSATNLDKLVADSNALKVNISGTGDFSGDMMAAADKLAQDVRGIGVYDLPLTLGPASEETEKFRMWEVSVQSLNLDPLEYSPLEKLHETIGKLKDAIERVSTVRGYYGAYTNRLEHAIQSGLVYLENLAEAESVIRDTDVAESVTAQTRDSILAQCAQAMLAQANQVPQGVLSLMK